MLIFKGGLKIMKWSDWKLVIFCIIIPLAGFIIVAIVNWKIFIGMWLVLIGVGSILDIKINYILSLINKKEEI